MFGVTILGNNSALPAYDRHPTSQVVTLADQVLMIDCGEGTQMQLTRFKIRRSRINHIFISHLHGDHYFGLPGLITSLGLLGREAKLNVYGPPQLEGIIRPLLNAAEAYMPYQLIFNPLPAEGVILDTAAFTVECFPVVHRIECWGFLVKEKRRPRKVNRETIINYNIPTAFFERLKDGEDYIDPNGNMVPNAAVTLANTPGKSYAYCADTKYNEGMLKYISHADMVYHEATYLHSLQVKAAERCHSTSFEAGKIADLAQAKQLLIGHFSSKYEELDELLAEAQQAFPAAQLALEGVTYLV